MHLRVMSLLIAVVLVPNMAFGDLVFDNGGPDPDRTTWNMHNPDWTVYDDFVLSSATTITRITFNDWEFTDSPYTNTSWSILDGLGGNVLASGTQVAGRTLNGLSHNGNPSTGYLSELDGLSINLSAGTYFLGLTSLTSGSRIAIASGSGSGQTIGPGLTQNTTLRTGDHMSFQIYNIPEPGSALVCLVCGLGMTIVRRRNK